MRISFAMMIVACSVATYAELSDGAVFPSSGYGLLARRGKSEVKEVPADANESADQESDKKTFKGKTIRSENDDSVAASSSEALREGKSFDIVAELLGMSVAPLPSWGFTGGYYLRPDAVLELNYAHGKINFLIFEVFSNVYSLRLKKYWGNSFYTNSGLAVREVGGRTTVNEILGGSSKDEVTVSATSLAVDFAIGNKWQFEYFTIGCDWVGFMAPVAKMSTRDDYPAGSSEERREDRDSLNRLALRGSLQLLRFYLGASF